MVVKKHNFKISILFILFAIAIVIFDGFKNFVIYFLVVCIHEFAHSFVAKKLGYKLRNFFIMPYGVCLNYENSTFNNNDEILIAIAGPMVNYFLCLVCVALWWLFPETYYMLDYFCFCNLILAVFNSLPCFPLDGGRVLICLLSKKINRKNAIKFSMISNFIVSLILVIMFIISIFKDINFSYIFVAIFLFAGTINPSKYSHYNFLSVDYNKKKINNKNLDVKIHAFNSKVPIYKMISKFNKHKFNIAYIVFESGVVRVFSEININNLAIKYSPTTSVEDITIMQNSKN